MSFWKHSVRNYVSWRHQSMLQTLQVWQFSTDCCQHLPSLSKIKCPIQWSLNRLQKMCNLIGTLVLKGTSRQLFSDLGHFGRIQVEIRPIFQIYSLYLFMASLMHLQLFFPSVTSIELAPQPGRIRPIRDAVVRACSGQRRTMNSITAAAAVHCEWWYAVLLSWGSM